MSGVSHLTQSQYPGGPERSNYFIFPNVHLSWQPGPGLPQGGMPSSSLKTFWVWELAHLEMSCRAISLCAVIQGSLLFICYAYAARAKA